MAQQQQIQGCIQLIECVPPTKEERQNPLYVPQLKINTEAQQIIAENFESPISIIVYVGNMGVGKSKLATITVAALEKEPHRPNLDWFRSGSGPNGLTHGVWMWREPLQHPDGKTNGSILILDCEGMGDLDETTGANLYFFCMIISTAFAVILRPPRVDRFQCDRLYHALQRFEVMKSDHVLPNVFLLPSELPKFVISNSAGDEIDASKEKWLQKVLSIDQEHNTLTDMRNEELEKQYKYITDTLTKRDAINIGYLPESLKENSSSLDIHGVLRDEKSKAYSESINIAISTLLATGGKRLPGAMGKNLFVRPAELTGLMSELVDVINCDRRPNPDRLIEKQLENRFSHEIVKESMAKFKHELLRYTRHELLPKLMKLVDPQSEINVAMIDNKLNTYHVQLVREYCDILIKRASCEIVGVESSSLDEFTNEDQRRSAIFSLPMSIQNRLEVVKTEMECYSEAKTIIERARNDLAIENLTQQAEQLKISLDTATRELDHVKHRANRESRINESLQKANPWRVGVAPCRSCGAPGRAYNMQHTNCSHKPRGNLYYYNGVDNRMVCDLCRTVINCLPTDARCTNCDERLRVTKVF